MSTELSEPGLRGVAVNLLGVVEHPTFDASPYRIDADGRPYVPVGDGGLVLGVGLGDSVFAVSGDHVAPGACLVHPDDAARHALLLYSCIGNKAEVRTGPARGAAGAVIGKRGESGRLIVGFEPDDLARMRPGDQVSVRGFGQGTRPGWLPAEVTSMNIDPELLAALPVTATDSGVEASVRTVLPARLAGNGLGRPAVAWDLDLQLSARDRSAGAGGSGGSRPLHPPPTTKASTDDDSPLLLGDLVAITDIDARYNLGYRRNWVTIGVIVHGASPLPGHGPGMTVILTGPDSALHAVEDRASHTGLTASMLMR
jgi:hypothetical protein